MYTNIGMSFAFRVFALGLLLGLSACNSPAIYQDASFNPPVYFGTHVVREGETLYSIAWRYGRNYRELAAVNGISAPYRIYPGQRINLEIPEGFRFPPEEPKVAKVTQAPPAAPAPKRTVTAPAKKETKVNKKTQREPAPRPSVASGKIEWRWPGTGPIIDTFSAAGRINNGIDIGGSIGDPVHAAASGEVVYAGSGLLGYGQLVIIAHNEQFISAYAHNHRILVKEGEIVSAGQKIAEVGSSGANRPKLHFEIRKDGKPVNPLNYLPKR